MYLLNSFLHDVAQKYLVRYSLKNKAESFQKKAVILIWCIGRLKIKAKEIRLKMAPKKLKDFIRQWIVNWRLHRKERMQRQLLNFLIERKQKTSVLLRTAQKVYSYVVKIQRTFKRFLRRKKYIMCIYSLQWIVKEKRLLAQMKQNSAEMKEMVKTMDSKKLMAFQKTTIPL